MRYETKKSASVYIYFLVLIMSAPPPPQLILLLLYILKDPHANGEIVLGSSVDGFSVDESVPVRLADRMHIFMLHVPNRGGGGFPLLSDSLESKEKWVKSLSKVIAESTGSPDQSVAPSTYEEDEELYASID